MMVKVARSKAARYWVPGVRSVTPPGKEAMPPSPGRNV